VTRRANRSPDDSAREKPVRVTFVISGLVVGGAERVLIALANEWVKVGRPVTIVTFDAPERPPFFPVDPRIELRRLGLAGVSRGPIEAIANNLRRIVGLRRAIARTRPDAVVSFMGRTNVLTLLATIGQPWPIIVAERTSRDPQMRSGWRLLRRLAYRRAAAIVVQTQASARSIPADLRDRAVAIPNPVLDVPDRVGGPESAEGDPNLVVAIGRLVPQKGFDLLIGAFAGVVARLPRARLEIWGAGPSGGDLEAAIARASLGQSVTLCGETDDPAAVIRRSALLVLSSRVEGFPNVLLEAMALGRAVIAFDCPFGPAEIIRDGIDGRLVPAGDVVALTAATVALLSSPADRLAMGTRATDVRDRFALAAILAAWGDVVDRPGVRQR
jgi:glycosyltransferase involved in cell wall biosynthesis